MAAALVAMLMAPPAHPASPQGIFDRLVGSVWCDERAPDVTFPFHNSYNEWEFRPDGTWRHARFRDHPAPRFGGRWSLAFGPAGPVIVVDGGTRKRLVMGEGTVRIDDGEYHSCAPTGAVPRPLSTLRAIPLSEKVRSLLDRATRFPWMRVNDLDQGFRPTSVRFGSDWTYESVYRDGACRNRGTWTTDGDRVWAYSARNPCDERERYAEHIQARFLSDDQMLLHEELHVPRAALPAYGLIPKLFGYEAAVSVRVEYPRPLRRGRPTVFAFTFQNESSEDMLLERVALNSTFRDYRHKLRGMDVPEMAALDLGRRRLAPRESFQATLDVTFGTAGPAVVYFDVLVAGARQNWDVRQAHELRVAP